MVRMGGEQQSLSLMDIQLQNYEQPFLAPNHTIRGWEVQTIPPKLMEFLNQQLKEGFWKPEPCAPSGHLNCEKEEMQGIVNLGPHAHSPVRVNHVKDMKSESCQYLYYIFSHTEG